MGYLILGGLILDLILSLWILSLAHPPCECCCKDEGGDESDVLEEDLQTLRVVTEDDLRLSSSDPLACAGIPMNTFGRCEYEEIVPPDPIESIPEHLRDDSGKQLQLFTVVTDEEDGQPAA